MNSKLENAEIIDLEDYKKRRVEALKKRHRLSIVKALIKHADESEDNNKEEE